MAAVDALVFDFDGLILDTEWPAYITVAEAFEAHGVEMPLERWQSRIGRGDNAPWTEWLAAEVDIDIDHVVVGEARRARKDQLTEANDLLPGVLALLDAAAGHGLKTAVASSSPLSWVGRHLERHGILDRFDAVRTRDDVRQAKPWPDVFLAASDALGVAPERSIVFEDSANGVIAAKDAGMFCVAVPNRITTGGDFSRADLVVESLTSVDLASLLR